MSQMKLGRRSLALAGPALLVAALVSAQPEHDCTAPTNNPPQPGIIVSAAQYSGTGFPAKVLSLTYDDGPSARTLPYPATSTTVQIADYLKNQGIRATFFVVTSAHHTPCPTNCADCPSPDFYSCGCHTDGEEQPDLSALPMLVALGHRVGNHSHNHQRLDIASTEVRNQVCEAQQAIDAAVASPDGIYLLRPPGGGWSADVAGELRDDAAFNRIVGPVNWSLSIEGPGYSSDWDCAKLGNSPEHCGDQLLARLDQDPSLKGTVLLHDWIPTSDPPVCGPFDGNGSWALQLTQYLVPRLKQRGYLILPLDGDKELPGGVLFERAAVWSSIFSDGDGWGSDEGYYGTFRLGDVNGDDLMDVCARGILGMYCNLSTGTAFSGSYVQWQTNPAHAFRDDNGWLPAYHSTTIQLGDVDGDGQADVCGLGAGGVVCAPSTGSSFGSLTPWLSNAHLPTAVYQDVGYYGTLRLGDVTGDGKADLCFRGPAGLSCAISTGATFGVPSLWAAQYSDAEGWLAARWSTTIQLADLNGDGRADVCARGFGGLFCATSDGAAFPNPSWWSAGTTPYRNFSEADGFGTSSGYYRTLRLADLDGDGKADACVRSSAGVLCAKSTSTSFETYRVWQKADFRDDQGWLPDKYSATLLLGDVTGEGRADLCARSSGGGGLVCARDKS